MSPSRRIRICTAALFAAILLVPPTLNAQRPEADERAVKAAFLYNFTKFVEWPASAFATPASPFVVCAYSGPVFRKTLEATLEGEQVRGRPIAIAGAEPDDARTCHLLYFSRDQSERQSRILPTLRTAPVLSVGEGQEFLEQGGLVAFMLENDRVRFAINKRGADAAGLIVRSQLLRVARQFNGALNP